MNLQNDPGLRRDDILGGRYKILSRIGSGGMGHVYAAEDMKLSGKRWAVKEVRRIDRSAIHAFMREAEILAKLDHPCLPQIVDYFPPNEQGFVYLVMDLIPGNTVEEQFQMNNRQMAVTAVLDVSIQLCRCFRYLHESFQRPIVYRDLKPSNVMIDENGQVRLIDFGVARIYKESREADTVNLGTLNFAAPEQLEGRQTDPRTDLYQLGAFMYYLLSGGQYRYVTRCMLTNLSPELPGQLTRIVDKLLEVKPSKRFQTAAALEQELMHLLNTYGASNSADRQLDEVGLIRHHAADSHTPHKKIVVIGGLYPGSGATFAALTLARMLHARGISHSVVEAAGGEPQLYYWLGGDRTRPNQYVYYTERSSNESYAEWTAGETVWYPLRPAMPAEDSLESFDIFSWLHRAEQRIHIVDVSTFWEKEPVRQLCQKADAICFVADPLPAKFNGVSARKNVKHAIRLKEAGQNVQFIANRCLPMSEMRSWFDAFPWKPVGSIPYVDFKTIFQCQRKGKFVHETPVLLNACEHSLSRLIEAVVLNELKYAETKNRSKKRKWLINLK